MTSEQIVNLLGSEKLRCKPTRGQPTLVASFCWILLMAAPQLLSSCANPTLGVFSEPLEAEIHLDGRPAGNAPISLEPEYYGTVLIHAESKVEESDLSKPRVAFFGAKVQKVDFSAPVTPWLFGVDLVGETIVRLFGSMDKHVTLELPLVQPERDDALESMIEESEASSIAR